MLANFTQKFIVNYTGKSVKSVWKKNDFEQSLFTYE